MNRYQKIKSLILLLVVAVSAKAQIENGKVYNFVNVGNNTQSLVIASNNGVSITGTDRTDYDQLWYVSQNEDYSYSLRNLGNGRYLRSSNEVSVRWTMVKELDNNCKFFCEQAGSGYTLRASNSGYGAYYMHYGANQGAVVCWSTDAVATQWTPSEVTGISNETLNNNWNELVAIDPSAEIVATYQTALDNLFSDKACTVKKKSSLSESDPDYQALPEALKQMVRKVYNDSWAESNYDASKFAWSADYAKKYRVQLYEPYNEPEGAASALGINAHTNLNNPTGIFANSREAIYVMVEGTIKEGASLYIASYAGNGKPGGYAEGVELKEGLNIVPSFTEGNNYVINYVVHTFDTSKGKGNKAKARKLSDYDNLKIHIEGGYINGYWNKMGDELYAADTNADWEYIEARATQTTVTILGEYITLQFPLRDADAIDNDGNSNRGLAYYLAQTDVNKVIDEWDDIMMWERFLLGVLGKEATTDGTKNVKSPYSESNHVVEYTGDDGDDYATDYSDYYNVHGLSLGVGYNYMYGGWDHCGYHYNTMQSIIVDMLTSAGSHWGPGHEIGHQHQGLLNLNGLTEVTNNLFSNVVLWYFGETTSRVNGDEGSLSNVLAAFNADGSDFYTNNIWGQTHMYYKLFMYYHVLGHNPKFYPRLFEMLRQDPMINGPKIDGTTSLLHFYKKCCLASGDDLTEFFRAHGFFRVMNNRFVGDYSNATYNMSQKDIDEAIAEVKTWGYEENIAVLFINDATGETIKSHKGDNLELYGETTICAEVGSYASFADATIPDYTYNVVGNTVTMAGEGGIGFAIFNEKGELIAFSDKKTFQISDECVTAIAAEKASIMVVKSDNTMAPAVDVMDADDFEAKYVALGELLESVAELLTYSDADNTKPGFYKASVMVALQEAYESALTAYENKLASSYAATYGVLSQEYANVLELKTDKTPFLPGSTYVLTNKKYPNLSMTLYNEKLMCAATNMSSAIQQWTFEATDEKDTYYLKNVGGSYLGSLLESTQVGVTTRELASRYKLYDLGKGLWALQCQNDVSQSLHCDASYRVVGWSHTSTSDDGSWWYLTATAKDESMLPLYDLQNLITKTEDLMDEMAIVQGEGEIIMSTCTITSNAAETGHETMYLTDGNPSTFFHTIWQGTPVTEYHNVVIDLGEQHSLSEFVLSYKTLPTSAYNVDAPRTMVVSGSNDGNSYTTIETLTGLPTDKGAEYTTTLGDASVSYRYIRLQVTDATGSRLGGYYYFGLAELGLTRMATSVDAIRDKYKNFITPEEVKFVYNQLYVAQQKCATGEVTTADVEELEAQYNLLFEAYKSANNVEFNAKKEELLTLISNTNSLINTCGTVTYAPGNLATALALQTANPNGENYLSTNAAETKEGNINNLLIDDQTTYFHSAWSWDVNAVHHLKVDLGEGKNLKEFTFSYRTHKRPYPYEIKVYGSNNDDSYTLLRTFSKSELPTTSASDDAYKELWTSPTISFDVAYRYLRFDVTNSGGTYSDANPKGEYCFAISYFGITTISETESYTVELAPDAGDVTEELLLVTYQAVQEAQAIANSANTEKQLQEAYDKLKKQYRVLSEAKNLYVEYTISAIGADGAGGVIYNGVSYTETLNVLEALTGVELKAIDLDGYNSGMVTVDNEMGLITVSYTLDKSAWGGWVAEVDALISSCEAYVNSQYVTEALISDIETAINEAQALCNDATTLSEYEVAKAALQVAKERLAAAISSAEEEAAERVDLLQTLGEVIATVEAMIPDCGVITPEGGIESMNPNGSVTEEQLLTVFYAANAAKELDATYANATISATTAELQRLHDELAIARNTLQLPVVLTTDMEHPILYVIYSKRGNTKVLQYEPADNHMFSITDAVQSSVKQAFYFTVGDSRTQVYVHPFVAGEKVLAANDVSDGASKAFAMEKGVYTYEQWKFVKQAEGYNLQAVGTSTYFSNYGGGTARMGFYASNPDTDQGSRFTFVETTISAYQALKSYYDEASEQKGASLVGSDGIGYYAADVANAYNVAYARATELLSGSTATDAAYLEAYYALATANEALEINMPVEGKYYRFVSADKTNGREGGVVYATENKMYWAKDKETTDVAAIWTFTPTEEGTFIIANVHTGTYMNEFIYNNPTPLNDTAGEMSIVSLLASDGQIGIKCNGTMMHAQSDGAIVRWDTGANEASAWYIEEVDVYATNIDCESVEDDVIIYDLYGRRLLDIPASGLYIINGVKRYIQLK